MLGEKIAALRREKKMRQEDLAGLLGVSRQAISNYEKGERHPDPQMLRRLAKIFNVSSDYLLDLTDNPSPYRQVCEEPCFYLEQKLPLPLVVAHDPHDKTLKQLYCLLKKLSKEDRACLLHLIKRLIGLE
ncbi:MAG: helix-turn-helix transcriptional regulator [Firmicutes bacterium]|nr:helix-turn-helix transcriptional regulator [Bacillota bacterium]